MTIHVNAIFVDTTILIIYLLLNVCQVVLRTRLNRVESSTNSVLEGLNRSDYNNALPKENLRNRSQDYKI